MPALPGRAADPCLQSLIWQPQHLQLLRPNTLDMKLLKMIEHRYDITVTNQGVSGQAATRAALPAASQGMTPEILLPLQLGDTVITAPNHNEVVSTMKSDKNEATEWTTTDQSCLIYSIN